MRANRRKARYNLTMFSTASVPQSQIFATTVQISKKLLGKAIEREAANQYKLRENYLSKLYKKKKERKLELLF